MIDTDGDGKFDTVLRMPGRYEMTRCLFLVVALVGLSRCGSEPAVTRPFLLDAADASSVETVSLFYETRRALVTRPGQSVAVEAHVPANPVLRFAIAASTRDETILASPVTFRLSVDGETRFEDVLRPSQAGQWFRNQVELGDYAGRTVRLQFEASSSSEGSVVALWGNPVLVAGGTFGTRPDIILISIDCLRADHLGVYGYERDTSPNLDAFAKEATVFRHAMASSSYTLPTHASMLTGLPPSHHGAYGRRPLFSHIPYAPELLAGAGYRVSGLVSGLYLTAPWGFARGFHSFRFIDDAAPRLVDEAIELLRESEGQSRFLFFHLWDPHMPYLPPRELESRIGEPPADVVDFLERIHNRTATREAREQAMALYDGEIALVDRELGRFFDALKASGAFDRSMIVVTGDHGEAFFEHGYWEHGHQSPEPGLYEELLHVPLIVKWPSTSSSSTIANEVSQMDVFPTILGVAGIQKTTRWAQNLTDARAGRTLLAEVPPRGTPSMGEEMRHIALRNGSVKYMSSPDREELYDLTADPGETTNRITSGLGSPVDFAALTREYWLSVPRTLPRAEDLVQDPELLEWLKALGYIVSEP